MKRFLAISVVIALIVPVVCSAEMGWGPGQMWKYKNPFWFDSTLTFWAPFNNPGVPLELYRGTGSFTFTRATSAWYTHPTTGLITEATDNILRIESNGALIEGARTNIATYSDDLTNAAWVKVTMDAATDQIGPDGVDNSASSITATGAAGTILQTVVSDNSAHSYSVYLKRLVGTGAVRITIDGTTWTAQTITSSWARYKKENTTVLDPLNPIIGIQLATSGDSVAVALNQLEVGAFSSSPIPTVAASVARNADVLTMPSASNISGTLATVSFEFDAKGANPYLLDFGTDHAIYWYVNLLRITDGTNTVNIDLEPLGSNTYKWVGKWAVGVGMGHVLDGGTISSGSFDGDMNLVANMKIGGYSGAPGWEPFGHIKNLRIWSRALTDAEMIAVMQ